MQGSGTSPSRRAPHRLLRNHAVNRGEGKDPGPGDWAGAVRGLARHRRRAKTRLSLGAWSAVSGRGPFNFADSTTFQGRDLARCRLRREIRQADYGRTFYGGSRESLAHRANCGARPATKCLKSV